MHAGPYISTAILIYSRSHVTSIRISHFDNSSACYQLPNYTQPSFDLPRRLKLEQNKNDVDLIA